MRACLAPLAFVDLVLAALLTAACGIGHPHNASDGEMQFSAQMNKTCPHDDTVNSTIQDYIPDSGHGFVKAPQTKHNNITHAGNPHLDSNTLKYYKNSMFTPAVAAWPSHK